MAAPEATAPAVSVVIPTRGRRELVRLAVESVVAQRYAGAIRCIVVHDQEAPDESLSALSAEGRTVEVVANTGATGLSASRNVGLRMVTTDFVASCDDDDSWLPEKLARQMDRLLAHPELWVVGAGIRLLMAEDRIVEWLGQDDLVTQADLFRSRRKELHSSTLLMRTTVFERVGGYDEKLPQSYAEDYEWLLRAATLGPLGVVREPLALIKKDGQSWFRERNEVVSDALQYLLLKHPEIRASRAGEARILGQIAFAEASLGHRKEALRWAGRSLVRWPLAPQAGLALVQVVFAFDPRTLLRSARLVGRGLS
jgi:hypothetical protein